jgi:malate dehydrogenase (oxaloacetate-decarboxylating)
LKVVNKKMSEAKVAMAGAGASGIRTAWLMVAAGVRLENIVMCDSKGTLHRDRTDLQVKYPEKWELAQVTNVDNLKGDIPDAMEGADVLIGLSHPGPDVIRKEWIARMAPDPVVFACANPVPEIFPWDAKEGGARIVATGRSDFPNQINNSLGFPGIFRGTLDVRATTITDEMCIAAAGELARCAEDKGIHEEHIIPTMDEWEVFPREATAVGLKAIEQGVARIRLTEQELLETASSRIKRAREEAGMLMKQGFIKMPQA